GDLLLGFNKSGVNNDYILNLGNVNTAVGVGGTTPEDLSSLYAASTFNSTFTAGASGVSVGVAGGVSGSGAKVWATLSRSGLGTPSVPGSVAPGTLPNATVLAQAAGKPIGVANAYSLAAGATTVVPNDSVGDANGTSWSAQIAPGTPQNP